MTIRVEVRGAREALRTLGEMGTRARDLRPVFEGPIDKHVSSVFRRQFATEGGFAGRPWARLKPETVRAKERIRRGGFPILQRYRRLWGSLVKVGPDSVRRVSHQSYERGTRIAYAAPHQTGTRDGRLPQRQVVPDPWPRASLGVIDRLIARHLEGA